MTISDDTLSAYLDGELEVQDAERVRTLLARDADLAQRLERLRLAGDLTREAFAPLAAGSPPAALRQVAGARPSWRRYSGQAAVGLAACAAGFVLGVVMPNGAPSLVDDALRAAPTLARVLMTTPSGDETRAGPLAVEPLYSFRTADGMACRVFHARTRGADLEGAACREGQGWRVVALAPARPRSGVFTPAGGDEPAAIAAAVDALWTGRSLEPAEERVLIGRGWRR